MKKQLLLSIIKVILFLFFLSTCWMIYTTGINTREGFAPEKCSELGDCRACAGIKTSEDGICAWDSKIGSCRKPTKEDDATYVSISPQCSLRTTGFSESYTSRKTPDNAIWVNPNFGCPVCPKLHEVPGGSKITVQA